MRFVGRITFFLVPLAVAAAVPLGILWKSGEFIELPELVRAQEGEMSVLVGKAYIPAAGDLALQNVLSRKPDVVAVGNSRVLQFRAKFFKQGVRFFNAGGTIPNAAGYRAFLNLIPRGAEPRFWIVGIDQSYFNQRWDTALMEQELKERARNSPRVDTQSVINAMRSVYRDFFKGKINLSKLFSSRGEVRLIGLLALMRNDGLRNDGSYYYGNYIGNPHDPTYQDYEFRDTFKRIEKGNNFFEHGGEVSVDAVFEINRFLAEAKERGIYVVGFLPPYAHAVYETMMKRGDDYLYLKKIEPILRPLFAKHGFGFYDFSDLESIGASDDETIDGFHASEKAYLRLIIKIAEDDKELQGRVDISALRRSLDAANSDYEVFGFE